MNNAFRQFPAAMQRHTRASLVITSWHRMPRIITTTKRHNFHNQVLTRSTPPPKDITRRHLDSESKSNISDFGSFKYPMTCPDFKGPVWGFAIYRCAGGNDAAWNHILKELQDGVEPDLRERGWQDLLPYHDLHVIDDQKLYGATIDDVRQHFQGWVKKDIQARLRPESTELTWSGAGRTPRYQCFLYVDDLCLESVDYPASLAVKLVCLDWEPWMPGQRQVPVPEPWHDGVTDYDEEDVGWMYMPLGYYFDRYEAIDDHSWDDVYVRPPYIEGCETEDIFMGHWRRQKEVEQ